MPDVDPIWRKVHAMLNAEFAPGDDTYKGVAKDIHNLFISEGWQPARKATEFPPHLARTAHAILSDRVSNLADFTIELSARLRAIEATR